MAAPSPRRCRPAPSAAGTATFTCQRISLPKPNSSWWSSRTGPPSRNRLGQSAPAARRAFLLVHLTFDVAKLLLDEAGGVAHSLVVNGRPELANEEVEQSFGAKIAQRFVEFSGKMRLERLQQIRAPFG